MPVSYTGINHLAMATGDMDATIAYWRDLLGMRLVAGLGRPGYRHYFFEISAHDMIAFFEWPGVKPLREKDHGVPIKGPFAFDHLSLEVATQEDLRQLKDRLEAAEQWCVRNHRSRFHLFDLYVRPQQYSHRIQLAGRGN